MTGKGILEALSFVDEAYIEEAETDKVNNRGKKIVKALLPLAACLCVMIWGVINRDIPSAGEQAQQETGQMAIAETVCYEKDNSLQAEAPIMSDVEASEVPTVVLSVIEWTGEGFTAVVSRTVDTDILAVGLVLQVEMLPNFCVETFQRDLLYVERRVPTEADYPAGTLIQVRFRSYSEEDNTLRIESIRKIGE